MRTDYQQRLRPVLRYLEANFDQPFNLEEVALQAHLSPYHFHRIFKAVVGETLADFMRRLKMEKSASVLFYHKRSITEVALDFGFSSSQAFAKAFKQHFGLTASQVRECQDIEAFSQLMRNSKIGHSLRKNGNELDDAAAYTADSNSTQWRQSMTIESFTPCGLAYVRVTGPYGQNYPPAVEKLYQWAGPAGFAQCPCIFIYHDNPELTPAEKCRTDIALLVPEGIDVGKSIEYTHFEGGKYFTSRRKVTDQSQYGHFWNEHMGLVVEQGLETDQRPCFELYHHYDPVTHHADVSFCTAVK
ncbi:AraC family transcriptional regulator [Vibrio metoecus]|uniref:AraC family transcriptional regulator n=1 Tax=Vibrio metoecus TaxID=1481663 RepID=A0A271VPH9_VIBMT|nr:AraC family transcriptional regulator [Vibrio metoecus]KDO13954.1 AraC family transcriptional regulator [Vibrio metoecus]KQA97446.1 AraC family transcriptional regulator [Vibrio metoecus]KQB04895.1 AraC family transcriptional regulator [Vibrio metoecus]KQB08355.1 AraC family transcriptional regulator [Vibrio metoecus]MCR9388680.1 AraC family transcriptional regulator [Vibrio metoecus]